MLALMYMYILYAPFSDPSNQTRSHLGGTGIGPGGSGMGPGGMGPGGMGPGGMGPGGSGMVPGGSGMGPVPMPGVVNSRLTNIAGGSGTGFNMSTTSGM